MTNPQEYNKKKPRPALRMNDAENNDIHDKRNVYWVVERYGRITTETRAELQEILEKHPEYEYKWIMEGNQTVINGELVEPWITLRVNKKGSFVCKFLDNEKDARQTIENFK